MGCTELTWENRTIPNPIVIVEVLSPSTQQHDKLHKLIDCQSLSTVQNILIVSIKEEKVQHWKRQGEGWFAVQIIGNGTIQIDSLNIKIPLAEIF